MSSIPLAEKIQANLLRKNYLQELSELTGNSITNTNLLSYSDTKEIQGKSVKALNLLRKKTFQIAFDEKKSDRFLNYIHNLSRANPSAVYIWTHATNSCGSLKIDSLLSIKFEFVYTVNSQGIVSFLSENCSDRLLLDFTENESGDRVLTVETQGVTWPDVVY